MTKFNNYCIIYLVSAHRPENMTLRQQYRSEFSAFRNAKDRCNNIRCKYYKSYGGRGIQFLFNNFEEFMEDVGPKPFPEATLDREDNNGHYEKGNCRWITHAENLVNRGYGERKIIHQKLPVKPIVNEEKLRKDFLELKKKVELLKSEKVC